MNLTKRLWKLLLLATVLTITYQFLAFWPNYLPSIIALSTVLLIIEIWDLEDSLKEDKKKAEP